MAKMKKYLIPLILTLLTSFLILAFILPGFFSTVYYQKIEALVEQKKVEPALLLPLDIALYDKKLEELANNPIEKPVVLVEGPESPNGKPLNPPVPPPPVYLWPAKAVYPNAGAILPFKRVIAYYGNLYSTKMGVLGQYPEAEMLERLDIEVKKWELADPSTPVIPALHYIAVVAQGSAGADGKYRARMPSTEIDKVLAIAEKINALVFLDIQVGFSTLQIEVPLLEKYLKLPNVHLGVDAEFSMKSGIRPGKVVGTLDAVDINFTTDYLARVVRENNLTPKILVVHRYTQKMLTNYKAIKPLPEVQIVMHMDGWGDAAKKINTYQQFVYKEPVQFTGFKLFYKNDLWTAGTTLMTPEDLLKLRPKPIYIQYQ